MSFFFSSPQSSLMGDFNQCQNNPSHPLCIHPTPQILNDKTSHLCFNNKVCAADCFMAALFVSKADEKDPFTSTGDYLRSVGAASEQRARAPRVPNHRGELCLFMSSLSFIRFYLLRCLSQCQIMPCINECWVICLSLAEVHFLCLRSTCGPIALQPPAWLNAGSLPEGMTETAL